MWYFTWILGVTAALAIGVINVMWYEFTDENETQAQLKARRDGTEHPQG